MANLRNVVYLTQEQYDTLLDDGTITVGDTTITYNENDLYLVPESRSLYRHNLYFTIDVTINGSNYSFPSYWYVITNSATQFVAKDLYTYAHKLVFTGLQEQGPVEGLINVYTTQTGASTYGVLVELVTSGQEIGVTNVTLINSDGTGSHISSFSDTVEQLL